jgi:hypothetical protein
MLLMFREMYGEIPKCNTHGRNIKQVDEFRYFRKEGIRRILEDLA